MNPYNYSLDLSAENSNSCIIERIESGSRILEFGPAFGRMTKYLTEEHDCIVDIVELDEEAGNHAKEFARTACVGNVKGNIELNEWYHILKEEKYDYIIFADVLEHLRSPENVLKKCERLLKSEGAILCSVPNIAHASIILNLIQNKFEYTSVGLLDRTHISFFTEESFKKMANASGFFVSFQKSIVIPVGSNEIPIQYGSVPSEVERMLKKRSNNETYQYIFELKKSTSKENEYIEIGEQESKYLSTCYIRKAEEDYSENKKIVKKIIPNHVKVLFDVTNFENGVAAYIRLLNCNSVIKINRISVITVENEEKEISSYYSSSIEFERGYILAHSKCPEIFLDYAGEKIKSILVDYEVLEYQSDVLKGIGNYLEKAFRNRDNEISVLKQEKLSYQENCKQEIQRLNEKKIELEQKVAELEEKNVNLLGEQEIFMNDIEQLKRNCADVENAYEVFKEEMEGVCTLAEAKNAEQFQQIENLFTENEHLHNEIMLIRKSNEELTNEINRMASSYSWKLSKPLRMIRNSIEKCFLFIKNTHFYYTHFGLKASIYRALHYKKIKEKEAQREAEIINEAKEKSVWDELSSYIDRTPHDFIDIFSVPMGWNTPLFQRFQHLSLQVGKLGGISFYGAHPSVDTDVTTYKFINPTLCIVNLENAEVANAFWNVLDTKIGLKYIRLQSIDLATKTEDVELFIKKGYQIVYEYIDELTPQITGNIPEFVWKRHEYLLRNEDVIVVATSDKLYGQVKPFRSNNMLMLNNGVDYTHWHIDKKNVECPKDLECVVEHARREKRLIVGYHGALAQWIDYELLKNIADDKRYILLLIGFEHDGNLKKSNILNRNTVYYLGAKSYEDLNSYAIYYDIAILPFVINNITLSVSPVKIFEYMAAGKPVVSYALPECKKYRSCLCAESREEFIQLLEKAIYLRDDVVYLKQLNTDALNNTWQAITKKMLDHVKKIYYKKISNKELLNTTLSASVERQFVEQIMESPQKNDLGYYCKLTENPYTREEGDCKIIAYYLTQFHPDKHNEEWWGKGVTEWNNVCRAVPQFVGHYQPRLPGELGFYDLRIIDNMKRQIELAQMYGVYGFSYYYYWFDGERLLEKPLEMFLEHKELEFPFCLCWANENWTKKFDGTNEGILMEQPKTYDSYCKVIEDMARFLKDSRYIEVNGKKVVTIYRPSLMINPKKVLLYWRTYCTKHNIGELYIIAVKENMVDIDWLAEGFDALSEFHPGTLYTNCRKINDELSFIRKDFGGEVYSYPDIVHRKKYFNYNLPKLYRAIMPMWDNTARRDNNGMIFHGATPLLYKRWLKDLLEEVNSRTDIDDKMIFVNAWNEWGEGAYLEPDKCHGYAYLEATKEALIESRESVKKEGEQI